MEELTHTLHRAYVEPVPCVCPLKGDALDQLKLVHTANFFTTHR
jgi:hypothetical protein